MTTQKKPNPTKARIAKAISKVFGVPLADVRGVVFKGHEDVGEWNPSADFIIHLEGIGLPYEYAETQWKEIEELAGIWIEPYNSCVLSAYKD